MANAMEMTLGPSPSDWWVRLLSIYGQVSLVVEKDFHWHRIDWSIEIISQSRLRGFRKYYTSPGKLVGSVVSRNFTVSGDSDRCDTEAPRKKVKAATTLPADTGVIHNVWKRSYGNLTITEDRDEGSEKPGRWLLLPLKIRYNNPAVGGKRSS